MDGAVYRTEKLVKDNADKISADDKTKLVSDDKIRRVMPDRDAVEGFREEDCIPCSPRPLDEMWKELLGRIESVVDPHLRELLRLMVTRHADRVVPARRVDVERLLADVGGERHRETVDAFR